MEITIRSTALLSIVDGVPVRLWEGTTAGGVPCLVLVHRLAVRLAEDSAEFDRELKEQLPPGRRVPLRMILDAGR